MNKEKLMLLCPLPPTNIEFSPPSLLYDILDAKCCNDTKTDHMTSAHLCMGEVIILILGNAIVM